MSKNSVYLNMRPAYAWMTKAPPKAEREMLAIDLAHGFDSDLGLIVTLPSIANTSTMLSAQLWDAVLIPLNCGRCSAIALCPF